VDVTQPAPSQTPSTRRILQATLVAVVVAGVLLVTVVLPAEYGVDPLGTGEALGLTALADASAEAAITERPDGVLAATETFRLDSRTFTIGSGEYVEYKYGMDRHGTMVYSWTADAPVRSEMHSDPWWRGSAAEFFEVEESTAGRHGSYTAPFRGVHGWYWLNEGDRPVTVTIHAAGFFDASHAWTGGSSTAEVRAVTETPWGEEGP
jgi:hypothetical protein